MPVSGPTPSSRHAKSEASLLKFIMDVKFTVEEESRFPLRLDLIALTQSHKYIGMTGSQRYKLNLRRLRDHRHHPSALQTNSISTKITEFWMQRLMVCSDHRNLFGRPGSQDGGPLGRNQLPAAFQPGNVGCLRRRARVARRKVFVPGFEDQRLQHARHLPGFWVSSAVPVKVKT